MSTIKKSIVVVNEYTIKDGSKYGGTRGGTPGDYILRYMGREDATEISTPVKLDNEPYTERYNQRMEAADDIQEYTYKVGKNIRQPQRQGGIAFSNKTVSLSNSELKQASKDIQQAFDSGKTVLKTVISFEEEYLRDNNVISPDFKFSKKGDYKGNIDQIKLRYAIMRGLDNVSEDYDDLNYVGIIQVDAKHVHCHLAMVDMGEGKITEDGTQKGKISAISKKKLRSGIEMALEESKGYHFMSSYVDLDKRNIQTTLKKYTYDQITLYVAPQKLMSVLPEDEAMWEARSYNPKMDQANTLCRNYVEQILSRQDSGMDKAMRSVLDYANYRAQREELNEEQQRKLVEIGRSEIVESCMDSVYAIVKTIPEDRRTVSTDFINLSAAPIVAPSFKDDAQDFVYKARAYISRLEKHTKEAKKYSALVEDYETAQSNGLTDPSSLALYNYFQIEQEYQKKLESKYAQFIFVNQPDDALQEELIALEKKARKLYNMELFYKDESVRKMSEIQAEQYGRKQYGVYGGKYIVADERVFEERINKYRNSYNEDQDDFNKKLRDKNFKLSTDEKGHKVIVNEPAYPFDQIRGLDIQDLRGDFEGTLKYSDKVKTQYLDMARKRIDAYDRACDYLDNTDQGELKSTFDQSDIENMRYVMNAMNEGKNIETVKHPIIDVTEKKVVPLDRDLHQLINKKVKNTVSTLEYSDDLILSNEISAWKNGYEYIL